MVAIICLFESSVFDRAVHVTVLWGVIMEETTKVIIGWAWHSGPFCPWDSPGKNTRVGRRALLQGTFPARDRTRVSCTAGGVFTIWAPREARVDPSSCCPLSVTLHLTGRRLFQEHHQVLLSFDMTFSDCSSQVLLSFCILQLEWHLPKEGIYFTDEYQNNNLKLFFFFICICTRWREGEEVGRDISACMNCMNSVHHVRTVHQSTVTQDTSETCRGVGGCVCQQEQERDQEAIALLPQAHFFKSSMDTLDLSLWVFTGSGARTTFWIAATAEF